MGTNVAKPMTEIDRKIIEMHFLIGMPVGEVAKALQVPKRLVKKVINDPRTEELVEVAKDRITDMRAENLAEAVGGRIERLRVHATKALEKTLTHEIHPLHKAKPNQDRVALKLLQGTGDISDKSEEKQGGITLTEEQFGKLLEGLSKADRVRDMEVETGKIPEADYSIEEDEPGSGRTDES